MWCRNNTLPIPTSLDILFHSKVYDIIRCYATILAKMLFYPYKRETYLNK